MVEFECGFLEVDHFVEIVQGERFVAVAREIESGEVRTFLINNVTGAVCIYNGISDEWEKLYGIVRGTIIARIIAARNSDIPLYRVKKFRN